METHSRLLHEVCNLRENCFLFVGHYQGIQQLLFMHL